MIGYLGSIFKRSKDEEKQMDFQNHLHELEMWDETPWREWLRDFRRSSSKIRSGRIERFVNELQSRLLFTPENVEILLTYVDGEITAEEHDRPSKRPHSSSNRCFDCLRLVCWTMVRHGRYIRRSNRCNLV